MFFDGLDLDLLPVEDARSQGCCSVGFVKDFCEVIRSASTTAGDDGDCYCIRNSADEGEVEALEGTKSQTSSATIAVNPIKSLNWRAHR